MVLPLLSRPGIESHTFNKIVRDVQQQECLYLKFFELARYPQQFSLRQPHLIFSPLSWINLDYMTFNNYLVIYPLKKKTMWITWYAYYTILRNRALTTPGTDLHKFKHLLTHDVEKWSYASSIYKTHLSQEYGPHAYESCTPYLHGLTCRWEAHSIFSVHKLLAPPWCYLGGIWIRMFCILRLCFQPRRECWLSAWTIYVYCLRDLQTSLFNNFSL